MESCCSSSECSLKAFSGLLVAAWVGHRNLGLVLLKINLGTTRARCQTSPLATEVRPFWFMSTTFYLPSHWTHELGCGAAPEQIYPLPSHSSCISLHQPAGTSSLWLPVLRSKFAKSKGVALLARSHKAQPLTGEWSWSISPIYKNKTSTFLLMSIWF